MGHDFDSRRPGHKQAQRQRILDFAKQSWVLYSSRTSKFRCSWLELAGKDCPALPLVQPHIQEGHSFIGVDTDASTLQKCTELHPDPRARWHHGRLEHLVMERPEWLEQVGVLNFDSENAPGEELENALELIGGFATGQAEFFGEFILAVNVVCRPYTPDAVCQWVREIFPRYLPVAAGQLDGIEQCVYRSRTVPMLNLVMKVKTSSVTTDVTAQATHKREAA